MPTGRLSDRRVAQKGRMLRSISQNSNWRGRTKKSEKTGRKKTQYGGGERRRGGDLPLDRCHGKGKESIGARRAKNSELVGAQRTKASKKLGGRES